MRVHRLTVAVVPNGSNRLVGNVITSGPNWSNRHSSHCRNPW